MNSIANQAVALKPSTDNMGNELGSKARVEVAQKIEVNNLNFFYGPRQALHGISLKMRENRVTALIGPSGCGKSTFLRTLNRMYEMIRNARAEGVLQLDGENIMQMDVATLRRRV